MTKSMKALAVAVALLSLGAGVARAGIDDKWCVGNDDACVGQDGQIRMAKPFENSASTHAAVGASTQVVLSSAYLVVFSTGGVVPVTSAPSVKSTWPSGRAVSRGTCIILRGSSDANSVVLQDDDSVSGTRLELGASSRTLGFNDMIQLCYDSGAGRWLEAWYANLD